MESCFRQDDIECLLKALLIAPFDFKDSDLDDDLEVRWDIGDGDDVVVRHHDEVRAFVMLKIGVLDIVLVVTEQRGVLFELFEREILIVQDGLEAFAMRGVRDVLKSGLKEVVREEQRV